MENIAAYRNGEFLRQFEPQEYFLAKRDIAGFFEEQSNWATLYGDSDFGTVLNLPYWDYLDVRNVNESEAEFLRTGSLLILASMALEPYEDLGTYYLIDKEKAELFINAITKFQPNNENELRLKNLIIDLRNSFKHDINYDSSKQVFKKLENEFRWIRVTYIYGYFRNKAKDFGEHMEVLYKKENER